MSRVRTPQKLLDRLARGQCVAYVGAGFSAACGMPGWRQLLERLLMVAKGSMSDSGDDRSREFLQHCARAIKHGECALASSLLRRVLPPADLYEAVKDEFDERRMQECSDSQRQRMTSRLDHLVRAPWAGVITTNYDTLIDINLGRTKRMVNAIHSDSPQLGALLAMPAGAMFYVKLHGSLTGEGIVLTTEEYDQAYLVAPRIRKFLQAAMLRYHVVFVGCSLEDQVVEIRRQLARDFDGHIPTAYALLQKSDFNLFRREWLRESAKIESILYEDADHRPVDDFLREACAQLDPLTDPARASDALSTRLLRLGVGERLSRVGTFNRRLLRLVARTLDGTIEHVKVVGLAEEDLEGEEGSLLQASPDERVYRLLFLVSIGLLVEEVDASGATYYRVPDSVLPHVVPST